jgi:hypothetical protein
LRKAALIDALVTHCPTEARPIERMVEAATGT